MKPSTHSRLSFSVFPPYSPKKTETKQTKMKWIRYQTTLDPESFFSCWFYDLRENMVETFHPLSMRWIHASKKETWIPYIPRLGMSEQLIWYIPSFYEGYEVPSWVLSFDFQWKDLFLLEGFALYTEHFLSRSPSSFESCKQTFVELRTFIEPVLSSFSLCLPSSSLSFWGGVFKEELQQKGKKPADLTHPKDLLDILSSSFFFERIETLICKHGFQKNKFE